MQYFIHYYPRNQHQQPFYQKGSSSSTSVKIFGQQNPYLAVEQSIPHTSCSIQFMILKQSRRLMSE